MEDQFFHSRPRAGVTGPEPDLRGDPRRLPLDRVDDEQRLLLGRLAGDGGGGRLRQVPLLALRVRRHRDDDALGGARTGPARHTGQHRSWTRTVSFSGMSGGFESSVFCFSASLGVE